MQTKWVNDLNGQPFIEMILIPSGHFTMGSNTSSYNSEKPERNVFLHNYYISKYPITNKQFYHFIQETGYANSDDNFLQHWITNSDGTKSPPEELLDHPVVYVNWVDCYAFCKTYGLTLPSEAQWEKAARGSDKRIYPWGDEEPNSSRPQCNFRNIFDGTTPVSTFDGSRDSYNGIPIQKGTSPYGVEDMAGNVWEWCLDEWDSKWLENMGDNPVDPCNHKKRKQKGLSLDQIRAFSIQQQEVKEDQRPFQGEEYCEVVRGSTTIPPTSAPPIATTTTRRSGSASSASESASKKEEEVDKRGPFSNTESREEVQGTSTLPPTSVPPIAASTTHQSGTTAAACVVASKEDEEVKQIPFLDTESCGEVHGISTLPPSSVPPFVTMTTRRTGTSTAASESASKQEEAEEQSPFLETVCCGAVRGTTALPSTSAPPFDSTSIRHTVAASMALEVASEQEEEKEPQFPFLNFEPCGEVCGSPSSVSQNATSTTRRTGTTTSASESASEQKEETEDQIPFSETECCGGIRGSTTVPSSSAPSIVATTIRRVGTSSTVSESASKEEETEEQLPFQGTEDYGVARGAIMVPPTSASLIATSIVPPMNSPFFRYKELRKGS